MGITSWLTDLGLERHVETFRDNAIEMDVVADLTERDLADLGLPLGDRKRVMRGLAALSDNAVARIAAPTVTPEPAMPEPAKPGVQAEAERRHLTVMFVDLVGSTRIASELDPEEMRDLLRTYQNVVAGEVSRFDGYVAKFMGDGVLCYFGFPTANEDDAERAVYAGQAIVRAVSRIALPNGETAQVRIGIASGVVVVGELIGEDEARERDVIGETPNIAARLQSVAEPGQVVIADTTNQLVTRTFRTTEVPLPELKGVSDSLRAFRPIGELTVEDRRSDRSGEGAVAFVGRMAEMDRLLRAWSDAAGGAMRSVLLTGEAGIGKSSVVQTFIDSIKVSDQAWFTLHASPYHQQTALYPVIQLIRRGAGIVDEDPDDVALAKLEGLLSGFLDIHPDAGANFANLLGIDFEGHFTALELAPQQLRARTLEQLTEFFLHRQDAGAQLVVVEDIHWLDHTTVEVLLACMMAAKSQGALFLFAGRSDGIPSELMSAALEKIHLERMDLGAVRSIVDEITQQKSFPDELVEEIFKKTDGVPLFVRELTKTIMESGLVEETDDAFRLVGAIDDLAIPSTLHDSLMARLDRLPNAKGTAQIAACIGRTFDLEVLTGVARQDQTDVLSALEELINAELVERTRGTSSVYSFHHALVCDAAYSSLLKSQRRRVHGRVAHELNERSGSPEALAYHYERADLRVDAAACLMRAGQNALRICAAVEAINRFQHGIQLLDEEPATEATKLLKMRLSGMLGTGYMLTKSWGADEVYQAYAQALELADATDNLKERIWIIWGAWVFRQVHGQLRASRAEAERAMDVARETDDDEVRLVAHMIMLQLAFYQGHWKDALTHGAEIERLFDPDRHSGLKDVYSLDLLLVWYVHGCQAYWMTGDFKKSAELKAKADAYAKDIDHTHSRAWVAVWGANQSLLNGNFKELLEHVPAAIKLGEEFGFDYVAQLGQLLVSAAQLGTNPDPGALDAMDAALARFQSTGAGITLPYFLTIKAQALLRTGKRDLALTVCDDALARIAARGECWAEAFALKTKGDILAASGEDRQSNAKAAYIAAIECAKNQSAIVWQAEAELALYHFLAERGDKTEANDMRNALLSAQAQMRSASELADRNCVYQLVTDLRTVTDSL